MTMIKTIIWETPTWTPELYAAVDRFSNAPGPEQHNFAAREVYDTLKTQKTGVIELTCE